MGFICRNFPLSVVLFVGLIGLVAGSSFISDHVFETHGIGGRSLLQTKTNHAFQSHGPGGRSLLQAKTRCPDDFEHANYTVITSRCKGPSYPADKCCAAFKEFACPFAADLNDDTNDCATTMFTYINLYGSYPPGLFSSECREGKDGLACPAASPAQPAGGNNSAGAPRTNRSFMTFPAVLVCAMILAFLPSSSS